VESPSPDSLFWKIDFILKYLPTWLTGPVHRSKMNYRFASGSTITGEASTGRAGVGGRATAMFVDEFSQIKEDFEVLYRTADTTRCRLFNFTHTGLDTAAYELTKRPDMRKLRLHWSSHPEKNKGLYQFNLETQQVDILDKKYRYPHDFEFVMDGKLRSPWYDAECRRRGSARAIAMDLDINPRGSMAQFFDPVVIQELVRAYARPPFWEGDLVYDKETGKPIKLEKRLGGPIKLWCHLDHEGKPPADIYGMGGDISTGSGATPSCLTIANKRGEKVLEYANAHIDPKDLAPFALALCWLFGDGQGQGAKFAWELPGPGITFGKRVIELGYRNVYYRTNEQKLYDAPTDTPGWFATTDNKRALLEEYRSALGTRQYLNRSEWALDTCLAFQYTSKGTIEHGGEASVDDPTGARVNHGDVTISDALSWKMIKNQWAPEKKKEETKVPVLSLAWRREYHRLHEEEEEAALT
jgi:hypothetical protein